MEVGRRGRGCRGGVSDMTFFFEDYARGGGGKRVFVEKRNYGTGAETEL